MRFRALKRWLFPLPTPVLHQIDSAFPIVDAESFVPGQIGVDCFIRRARSEDPGRPPALMSEDEELVPGNYVPWYKSIKGETGDVGCHVLHHAVYEPGLFCALDEEGRTLVSRSLTPLYWRAALETGGVVTSRRTVTRPIDAACVACLPPYFTSYGHILLETLPRIWLARAMLGPAWDDVKVLLDSLLPDWAMELLRRAGVRDEQCIFLVRGEGRVRPRMLLLPGPMHGDFRFHSSAAGFFDAVEDDGSLDHPAEIYIPRHGSTGERIFENEAEIIALAEGAGLVVVEPWSMPWSKQVALFRQAKLIVGAHGSALHNAVFTPRSGAVVAFGLVNHIQASIAQFRGQRFGLVRPEAEQGAASGSSFRMSRNAVRRAIEIARSDSAP